MPMIATNCFHHRIRANHRLAPRVEDIAKESGNAEMVKLQYEMHSICRKMLDEIIGWGWAVKGAKLAILGAPLSIASLHITI